MALTLAGSLLLLSHLLSLSRSASLLLFKFLLVLRAHVDHFDILTDVELGLNGDSTRCALKDLS